jgi:hypothetical protein
MLFFDDSLRDLVCRWVKFLSGKAFLRGFLIKIKAGKLTNQANTIAELLF